MNIDMAVKYMLKMNHRITLKTFASIEDELGQIEQIWMDFKTLWCAVKTVQGREYFSAAAFQGENTYRFIIRYTAGIKSSMRVIFEGRLFQIESVLNDDEANRTITIIAKEKF